MTEAYSDHEAGERAALLQVCSFIIKHGVKEVDAFWARRLHDIMMDARVARLRPAHPWIERESRYSDQELVGIPGSIPP